MNDKLRQALAPIPDSNAVEALHDMLRAQVKDGAVVALRGLTDVLAAGEGNAVRHLAMIESFARSARERLTDVDGGGESNDSSYGAARGTQGGFTGFGGPPGGPDGPLREALEVLRLVADQFREEIVDRRTGDLLRALAAAEKQQGAVLVAHLQGRLDNLLGQAGRASTAPPVAEENT